MADAFFPRTTRYPAEKIDSNISIGHAQLIKLTRQILKGVEDFLSETFSYEKLKVRIDAPDLMSGKLNPQVFNAALNTIPDFSVSDHHANYIVKVSYVSFAYTISVTYIPCGVHNKPIKLFFELVVDYLVRCLLNIAKFFKLNDKGILLGSPEAVYVADQLTFNIRKTIMIEYLFLILNEVNDHYDREARLLPRVMRYDLKMIDLIWSHVHELAASRVENEEIKCGFIFQNDPNQMLFNSVCSVNLKPIAFGDFGLLKNYVKLSNGQDIFFNVAEGKINQLVITRNKVRDFFPTATGNEKHFVGKPLLVSIQDKGRIFFLEGGEFSNTLLFQIRNNVPIIRDNAFLKQRIEHVLKKYVAAKSDQLKRFIEWLLSLSFGYRGTSIIIGSFKRKDIQERAIKFLGIDVQETFLSVQSENLLYDFALLDQFVRIDGGLVMNADLKPVAIGTIVPNEPQQGDHTTGARHNSILSFTKSIPCLGIVVSEDGPISLYENGNRILKI